MKIIFFKRLLPALLLVGLLALPASAQKVATFNLQKALEGWFKYQQAQTAREAKGNEMDDELKKMSAKLETLRDDAIKLLDQSKDISIAATERESLRKRAFDKGQELTNGLNEIKLTQNTMRETLNMQWGNIVKGMVEDITKAVQAKAKAAGYTAVWDVSASNPNFMLGLRIETPIVLYSNGENDITEEILKQLNAAAPAGTLTNTGPTKTPPKADLKRP
jgi:Skp family chaperone for outer membrane proteins